MRKYALIFMALTMLLLSGNSYALDKSVDASVVNPFTAETIIASGDATSSAFPLGISRGYCSIQLTITGSGTLKLEFLVSNDGSTFGTVDNSEITNEIATGLTVGTYEYTWRMPPFAWVKIKATETGTSDPATISSSYMFIQ